MNKAGHTDVDTDTADSCYEQSYKYLTVATNKTSVIVLFKHLRVVCDVSLWVALTRQC